MIIIIFIILALGVFIWCMPTGKINYREVKRELRLYKIYKLKLNQVVYYNTLHTQGVYACLNNRLLQRNWQVPRDNNVRRLSFVRGWNKINNRKIGQSYLYHRTHLAPFRYTLLENSHVLVTGTSHLNCGIKPVFDYYPNIEDWQNYTYDLVKRNFGKTIKNPIRGQNDIDAHLSLEDFERLSTKIIKKQPYDTFVYYGQAVYKNKIDPCSYVRVRFYNQTKHKLLFDVILENK